MAGGKETGRQKMIGMMYLVLTALLAMNVSKEVVNAFVTIDRDQGKNLIAIDGKIESQLVALSKNANENAEKYGPANTSAEKIHKQANELIEHINKIKAKTFAVSINGSEAEITEEIYSNGEFLIGLDSIKALVGIDNYDNNTNLMIGSDSGNPITEDHADGNNYTAIELRNKLEGYRDVVVSELSKIKGTETLVQNVTNTFDYKKKDDPRLKPEEEEWVVQNFYHVPLAASTAMLSGLQNQIRLAESDLVDKLFTDVEGESLKFNRLTDAVIPQATTVSQGSSYEADVFLAAFDDQNMPEIRLGKPGVKWDSLKQELTGEFEVLEMEGTKGKVKIPAGGLGQQQREGVIRFKPVGGTLIKTPFKLDYNVIAPVLVVSPDKMNVFYKGLPNPVTVSVPGYTANNVAASISTGSMSNNGGGKYTVNVKSGTTASISATVTQPDGSKKSMPGVEFRIKRIPDPVPSFAQKRPSDNVITGTAVKNATGVRAVMEGFDFDLTVAVSSFKLVTVVNGDIKEVACSGNRLNAAAKGLIGGMRRGQKFSIEEIMVQMPDGPRKVSSISLRII